MALFDCAPCAGTYISNRASDKLTPLTELVWLLRSGSAADTQLVADYGELSRSRPLFVGLHRQGGQQHASTGASWPGLLTSPGALARSCFRMSSSARVQCGDSRSSAELDGQV